MDFFRRDSVNGIRWNQNQAQKALQIQQKKPHVKVWSTYETDSVAPLGQSTYFLGHTSHGLILRYDAIA